MSLLLAGVAGRGLVDPAAPVFLPDDEALLRGGAAFETLRTYAGKPFLLAEHLTRFRHSARSLALDPPDGVEELVKLVVGAAPPDHVLRLYRTSKTLLATVAALPDDLEEQRAHGLALGTFEVGEPADVLGGVKATSYGVSFAARRAAEQLGADEVVFVGNGVVLEASTANVWWRRGNELYTPATRAGVLPGVTRGFVCSVEPVVEGDLPLTDLLGADEAFITSSIREVMPVVTVDGNPIGDGRPGPAAARLQSALRLRSAA
jgi:branched-subunit amino acid aminotransferase/4-amino-4-deoxychorismate lyase